MTKIYTAITVIILGLSFISCSPTYKNTEFPKNENLPIGKSKKEIKPVTLTSDTFEDQISKGITIVDLWATWCGPCKAIEPIIDELAVDYANNDEITVAKLDIDKHKDIPTKYNVSAIPTILIFRNGALVESKVGAFTKGEMKRIIDSIQD